MVDVSRSILKEERRKNGPQGHSLTPTIKHGKETAIIQRLTRTNTQLGPQPSNDMTVEALNAGRRHSTEHLLW